MPVIAVTRMGWGKAFKFRSRTAADEHPLIQYGDAILVSPEDVSESYTALEIPFFCKEIGLEDLAQEFDDTYPRLNSEVGHPAAESYRLSVCRKIYERLEQEMTDPPSDPEVVLALIREDRHATKLFDPRDIDRRIKMAKREAKKEENTAPTEGGEAAPTEKKRVGQKLDGARVITMLKDKEGKQFGNGHNPKRAGSAAAARFAFYEDGMTIAQALEKGLTTGDLAFDQKAGFISIAPSAEPQAAAA